MWHINQIIADAGVICYKELEVMADDRETRRRRLL